MKVIPKESVVCNNCNTKDSFIYFGGPGGSRRVCMVCKNEQTGIDVGACVHQSGNPPELNEYDLADDPPEILDDLMAGLHDAEIQKDLFGYPHGVCPDCGLERCQCDIGDDNILEQQELEDYENVDMKQEVESRYRRDTQDHDTECECSKCYATRRDEIDKMYDFESDLEDYKVQCEYFDLLSNLKMEVDDSILEQQELDDYENIEHESYYFDV